MRGLLVIFGVMAAVVAAFVTVDALRPHRPDVAAHAEAQAEPDRRTPIRAPAPEAAGSRVDERPAPDVDACEPPLRVAPRDLAAEWPAMIGRRVSFVGRVERSLGFGESIVVAGGARFDVLLAPSDVWTGQALRTYRVIGSSTVRVAGPMRLPQLLLKPSGCERE